MTEARTQRADRLLPGDRIFRNGQRYRVTLVRHVPPDPTRGSPSHVEVEASPEQHESAALVASFEPEREVRMACRERDADRAAPVGKVTAALGVGLILAVSAQSGASLAGPLVRLEAGNAFSRLVAPCAPDRPTHRVSDPVGQPACRLDLGRPAHPRALWRT